jgi:hypothetical protein
VRLALAPQLGSQLVEPVRLVDELVLKRQLRLLDHRAGGLVRPRGGGCRPVESMTLAAEADREAAGGEQGGGH